MSVTEEIKDHLRAKGAVEYYALATPFMRERGLYNNFVTACAALERQELVYIVRRNGEDWVEWIGGY